MDEMNNEKQTVYDHFLSQAKDEKKSLVREAFSLPPVEFVKHCIEKLIIWSPNYAVKSGSECPRDKPVDCGNGVCVATGQDCP